MRNRVLALALLAGTLLVVAMPPASDAQRGRGGERPRPSEGRDRAVEPAPQATLAPGECGLDFDQVLEAIRESPEQASLMAVEPVTLAEILGFLPEGTTLLEYLVAEQETSSRHCPSPSASCRRRPGLR